MSRESWGANFCSACPLRECTNNKLERAVGLDFVENFVKYKNTELPLRPPCILASLDLAKINRIRIAAKPCSEMIEQGECLIFELINGEIVPLDIAQPDDNF